MGIDDLLAKLQREAVTPVTPEQFEGLPLKPLPLLAVTPVTPVTPKNIMEGGKTEPEHSTGAETEKSSRDLYFYRLPGLPGLPSSNGGASRGNPKVTPWGYRGYREEQTADAGGDPPGKAWRWLIHFADRNPVEVAFSPEATHVEVLDIYPSALAAEPMTELRQGSSVLASLVTP